MRPWSLRWPNVSKWERESSSRIYCLLLGLFKILIALVLRDPKIKIKKQLSRTDVPLSDSPYPPALILPYQWSWKLLCYFSDLYDLMGMIFSTFCCLWQREHRAWYMLAQRHSRPSASTHKSQSLWEGSHLWAEHSKCWTVSNNLYCRVISGWKWKRFLDPPNAERGHKSYNFMPATHVSYEGGNILSMTWMLCVVIKICLAKAVAQFETHLRVCVILGLRKDLKPI